MEDVVRITLKGLVQGQGVRPAVARLAVESGVAGTVRNSSEGVEIIVRGDDHQIEGFRSGLLRQFRGAVSPNIDVKDCRPFVGFRIEESQSRSAVATIVPPDLATCPDCLDEIRDSRSRRFGYPFTSCTSCGPRYSILREMPYDRERTSMNAFVLCRTCESEYRDPADRRFHAQTQACPDCGPKCWTTDGNGAMIADQTDAVQCLVDAIRAGRIVAIKGLGGYQLICDATNDRVVKELRSRKRRNAKPLPVMVRDLSGASELAHFDDAERATLASPFNPIVLVRARANTPIPMDAVHPGLREIGILLPTTPLHWMLADQARCPLIVTSGNASGEALAYENERALKQLAEVAELFLHHDREILRPIDDSVVRHVAGKAMTIRAARGIAPISLPFRSSHRFTATGGHQKVAPALATATHFVLAPHVGNMDSEACRQRMCGQVGSLQRLYGQPHSSRTACDQHPDYFTSRLAGERAIAVQHHHAHVAAAMLEHNLVGQTVLGFAFDGTGYGPDATVWGGEVLLVTSSEFKRVAHLRPFKLPGGESAITQPWRIALSLLTQLFDDATREWLDKYEVSPSVWRYLIDRGAETTSMGRLFDAVSSFVLGINVCDYEGEGAMRLETVCDPAEKGAYEFDLTETRSGFEMDWRPLIHDIVQDCGQAEGRIATKFHRAIVDVMITIAQRYDGLPIVVSGGVFQNRFLSELLIERTSETGLDCKLPRLIPAGDGGLSIGQLVVAEATLSRSANEQRVDPCA